LQLPRPRSTARGRGIAAACAATLALTAALASAPTAAAGTVPAGFQETTAFSGLTNPTAFRFAPDGRVYVAEKSGLIKVFDGLGDPSATVFADLRTKVHNFWDRGLLGIELDRLWSEYPWVYVLYTHDAAVGGNAPRWGTAGATSDGCPSPPGPTADGCVVSGRLSRLVPSGDGSVREDVLIEDWCQQYPSHSVGHLEQDGRGWLYASAGDGASFTFTDYGQDGSPTNPCGDPPAGPGSNLTAPSAEGGALRSQDLRTRGDPTGLDGSIIRVDRRDGSSLSEGAPLWADSEHNARRIIANGLRNPFRFTVDRDEEVWVGDVGWGDWEEINRFPGYEGTLFNNGWPCYEGSGRQPGYDGANLSICESLYAGNVSSPERLRAPYYAYNHANRVVSGESCPTGSSSISGLAFNYRNAYPAPYQDALFFSDYSRDCIWAMRAGAGGDPDPSLITTFDAGASNPVYLQSGPDGAIYYADFDGGRIQRIGYQAANQAPVAVASANPRSGSPPLQVQFTGSGSSDPDGDPLSYAWDLDGDGQYDDSTAANPTHTYEAAGTYDAGLRVSDGRGGTGTAPVTIDVGNTPPVPEITSPAATKRWRVGEQIGFAGSAGDAESGPLPPSALSWALDMEHCPSNCHTHQIQTFDGVAGGSFVAPDHEYPSHLKLTLTATDPGGLQASKTVRLDPETVDLTLATSPPGLQLSLNATSAVAPFTRTLIRGSTNTVSVPNYQTLNGVRYNWKTWSDGGARTHNVTVDATQTLTATFQRKGSGQQAKRKRQRRRR
jgi:PKD repeat protein